MAHDKSSGKFSLIGDKPTKNMLRRSMQPALRRDSIDRDWASSKKRRFGAKPRLSVSQLKLVRHSVSSLVGREERFQTRARGPGEKTVSWPQYSTPTYHSAAKELKSSEQMKSRSTRRRGSERLLKFHMPGISDRAKPSSVAILLGVVNSSKTIKWIIDIISHYPMSTTIFQRSAPRC